jgi:hypothetical protein
MKELILIVAILICELFRRTSCDFGFSDDM